VLSLVESVSWVAGIWAVFDIIDTTRPVNPQRYAIANTDSWAGLTIPPGIQHPVHRLTMPQITPTGWRSCIMVDGIRPRSAPHMCYSTDGGTTLQMFPTPPPNKPFSSGGGSLAVGNAGNVIVIWNTNARAVYTKDGGTTWADVPIPGIPANGTESGWEWQGNGYFLNKFVITYDKAGGFFYAFNYGPTSNTSLLGIWKSSNGDSWTQQCTPPPRPIMSIRAT
jgi:hypothetical protein